MNRRRSIVGGRSAVPSSSNAKRPSTVAAEDGREYGGESSSRSHSHYRPPWSSGQSTNVGRLGGSSGLPSRMVSPYAHFNFEQQLHERLYDQQFLARPMTAPLSQRSSHMVTGDSRRFPPINLSDTFDTEEGERSWEHTGVGQLINSNASSFNDSFRFTILSYNILASGLLDSHPEVYKSCDQSCLQWERRLIGIFGQIEKFNPTIICLQEVEAPQFALTFEPRLADLGYHGVFKKKTGDKYDGCAIFYKSSKFILIDKLEVEFKQPHVPLLNRDNIALFLKLETRNQLKRQKLIVGTTHLLFNPKRHDVRLGQTQLMLAELDRFAFCGYDKEKRSVYHPVLMTGDFNCQPHDSVVRLFLDGHLQYLDENGELVRWLRRSASAAALLPSHLGITDECQHYKVILERYRRWAQSRTNHFELGMKFQEPLVEMFPYLGLRPSPTATTRRAGGPSHGETEVLSLYSPIGETVHPTSSFLEADIVNNYLQKASDKLALQAASGSNKVTSLESLRGDQTDRLDQHVLMEMAKNGLPYTFGSGRLSHNFNFRDIYGAKLDRRSNEPGVTTKQSGWSCVDYIFQSMTWNESYNKAVEGKLKLVKRLGLLSRNQCKQFGDIPNHDHPSDHFPLLAEFLLR